MAHQRPHRNAGDMEVGVANVIRTASHQNQFHHAPPTIELPTWLERWEGIRPRWLVECFGEVLGVFLYTYLGIGASCAYLVTAAAKQDGGGSLLETGFAYALGIVFGVLVSGPTSGSHLSPGYTISFALYKGFPWRKVPQYILSQLLGAFLAALVVYGAYKQPLDAIIAKLQVSAPQDIYSATGPAGLFALLPMPDQGLGYAFMTEIFATTLLSIMVFTVLDMSNPFISYPSAPILIGMGYASVIWAYSPVSLVLNTARDLGGRFVARIFFGPGAFPAKYTALAVFTNILGTMLGGAIQILFLADSTRPLVNQPTPPPTVSAPAEVHRVVARQDGSDGGALEMGFGEKKPNPYSSERTSNSSAV
ncbi:hypothetical protein FRB96_005453 [Tulasnella sp. 330]|nr:hypothetical protein FRB96_005453 [Tulasnella sp. 330]KAG8881983.1 hypothetical protein FRB97_008851 [Tulasnella sp. 331]KAG8888328.1 hypothetical protein FRB98_007986 [Tulasnella sp. 332]